MVVHEEITYKCPILSKIPNEEIGRRLAEKLPPNFAARATIFNWVRGENDPHRYAIDRVMATLDVIRGEMHTAHQEMDLI